MDTSRLTTAQITALWRHCQRAGRPIKGILDHCWYDGLLKVLFVEWPEAKMILGIEPDGHTHS